MRSTHLCTRPREQGCSWSRAGTRRDALLCTAWHRAGESKQEDESRATSTGGLQVLKRIKCPQLFRGDCYPLSLSWQQPLGEKKVLNSQDKLLWVTGRFSSSPGKCWLQGSLLQAWSNRWATKLHHIASPALNPTNDRNAETSQDNAMHKVNYQLFVLHSIVMQNPANTVEKVSTDSYLLLLRNLLAKTL